MVNKLLLPQEIETFYVIPALRKNLAMILKNRGMKQKDIAAIFGINTAAISQYNSNKRGDNTVFNEHILQEIKTSATRIASKFSYLQEMQRLLNVIRQTKTLCQIHKQFSAVPEDCEPHAIGCHPHKGCSS